LLNAVDLGKVEVRGDEFREVSGTTAPEGIDTCSANVSPQPLKKPHIYLDPIPQILQADVLVGGVLVVVVVGDGEDQNRRVVRLLEEVHGDAAAEGGDADG
jgi:hypothetical protein